MRNKICYPTGLILLAICFLAPYKADAYHWTAPPYNDWWDQIQGYVTDVPTLEEGEEIAAFRVGTDEIVGFTTFSQDSTGLKYSMYIYGTDTAPFDVYFLVWDGTSEIAVGPNYTADPEHIPPCCEERHDLGPTPEPPTAVIMGMGVGLVFATLAIARQRSLRNDLAARSIS